MLNFKSGDYVVWKISEGIGTEVVRIKDIEWEEAQLIITYDLVPSHSYGRSDWRIHYHVILSHSPPVNGDIVRLLYE